MLWRCNNNRRTESHFWHGARFGSKVLPELLWVSRLADDSSISLEENNENLTGCFSASRRELLFSVATLALSADSRLPAAR